MLNLTLVSSSLAPTIASDAQEEHHTFRFLAMVPRAVGIRASRSKNWGRTRRSVPDPAGPFYARDHPRLVPPGRRVGMTAEACLFVASS